VENKTEIAKHRVGVGEVA